MMLKTRKSKVILLTLLAIITAAAAVLFAVTGQKVAAADPAEAIVLSDASDFNVESGVLKGLSAEGYKKLGYTDETLPESIGTVKTNFKIEIPETDASGAAIAEVGTEAFRNCRGLVGADLGRIQVIGNAAFYGTAITSITFPDSVVTIGDRAFQYCSYLSCDLIIPDSVQGAVGGFAFEGCPITGISIGDGIETIGSYTFLNCSSATYIKFGKNVKYFFNYAFRGLRKLESLTLPDELQLIGNYAFADCTSLKNIDFGKGIQVTGYHAFDGDTALETVIIPAQISSVSQYSFYRCAALKKVIFEEDCQLVELASDCFRECYSLKNITVPNSVTSFGMNMFSDQMKTVYIGKDFPADKLYALSQSCAFNAAIVAPDKAVFDAVYSSATGSGAEGVETKEQLAYETQITVSDGTESFTLTKLANQSITYEKHGEIWQKSTTLNVGGYAYTSAKESGSSTGLDLATYLLLADGNTATSFTVDSSALSDNLPKPTFDGATITIVYGETFAPADYGYNGATMSIYYEGINGTSYTKSAKVPVNKGEYSITVNIKSTTAKTWTDGTSDAVTATLVINPRIIEVIWIDAEWTFDANAHAPFAKFADSSIPLPDVFLTADGSSVSDVTDAGTYTATAVLNDENYIISNPQCEFVILEREIEVEWLPLGADGASGVTSWVYDGNAHGAVGNLTADWYEDGLNFVYTLSADTETDVNSALTDGKAIDAGAYKVAVQAVLSGVESKNYKFTGGGNVFNFTISKAQATIVWADADSSYKITRTYDGASYMPQASLNYDGGNTVSLPITLNGGSAAVANAGTYDAVITFTDSQLKSIIIANYDAAKQAVLEITKATAVICWEDAVDGEITVPYDGNSHVPVAYYLINVNGSDVRVEISAVIDGTNYLGVSEAGEYQAEVELSEDDLHNCTFVNYDTDYAVKFIISRDVTVEIHITWVNVAFVYDGKAHKPVAYYTIDGGTAKYWLDVEVNGSADGVSESSDSAYTAQAKLDKLHFNYTLAADSSETCEFTISKKVLAVSWNSAEGGSYTYTGEEVEVLATLADYDGEYTLTYEYYAANGEKVEGKPVEEGEYTVKVSLADGKNYTLANDTLSFRIAAEHGASVSRNFFIFIIAGIAVVGAIALTALIIALKKRKSNDDNDGFYDDYVNDTNG